jgi:hypothetical protein
LESTVVAQIKSHPNPYIEFGCQLGQASQFINVPRRRLFNQHVTAGADRGAQDLGMRILRGCDDERVEVGVEQQPPVREGNAAGMQCGDAFGACEIRVGAGDERGAGQMLRSFQSHEPAANERNFQSTSPQLLPRSRGTMRRRV